VRKLEHLFGQHTVIRLLEGDVAGAALSPVLAES
jgi:hypothetical protein